MKLTNKHGIPEYIADWLRHDDYDYNHDPRTISATSLLQPVRVRLLTQRHGGELEQDIIDRISSRLGSAIHDSLERIDSKNVDKERRVSRKVDVNGTEWTVTGKYDVLVTEDNGKKTIRDIKTTSTWAYVYGGKDDDYRKQMSIYRWLLDEENDVNEIGYIDFFFTDWQKSKTRQNDNYPEFRIKPSYPIRLIEPAVTEEKIKKKLAVLQYYDDVEDDNLPYCTPDELWQTEDKWAVYKGTNARATKLCTSEAEAQAYIKDKKIKGAKIVHRLGEVRRCGYCSARPFCNQARQLEAQGRLAKTF